MEIQAPPVAGSEGAGTWYLHAHLWIGLEVWDTVLVEHLHLLQTVEKARAGEPWRRVDVAGFPFRPSREDPGLPADAGELLRGAVARVVVRVHRSPELGMLSGPDEPLAAFRARVLAGLRPEVRRRTASGGEGPPGPGLVEAVARLARGIETREFRLERSVVRRARLGLLRVPPGVVLPAPAAHDPMLSGGPREGRP